MKEMTKRETSPRAESSCDVRILNSESVLCSAASQPLSWDTEPGTGESEGGMRGH